MGRSSPQVSGRNRRLHGFAPCVYRTTKDSAEPVSGARQRRRAGNRGQALWRCHTRAGGGEYISRRHAVQELRRDAPGPCRVLRLRRNPAHDRNELRSEEHTSELQSLMRISYAVFCLKNKQNKPTNKTHQYLSITK